MTRTKKTGLPCVGEVRLAPLDVGYDLRDDDRAVRLPLAFTSAGIEEDGETYLLVGTRDEMVAAIRAAGYRIQE